MMERPELKSGHFQSGFGPSGAGKRPTRRPSKGMTTGQEGTALIKDGRHSETEENETETTAVNSVYGGYRS